MEPGAWMPGTAGGEGWVSPCLPRGTLVLIVGNNRTKQALVGRRAIVQRAVGLGGWHHVQLEDDREDVKLQVRVARPDGRWAQERGLWCVGHTRCAAAVPTTVQQPVGVVSPRRVTSIMARCVVL
jgi:hypothetical protein